MNFSSLILDIEFMNLGLEAQNMEVGLEGWKAGWVSSILPSSQFSPSSKAKIYEFCAYGEK